MPGTDHDPDAGDGAERWPRGAPHRFEGAVAARLLEGYRPLLEAADAAAALAALGRFRLLCAHRRGAWGVDGLNLAVERLLRRDGLAASDGWYPRRPVLVTANDDRQELFNGDQGVTMPGPNGLRVWFPGGDQGLRPLSPARLTDVETVFALSIHKSQGSEFDEVMVVLPPPGSPLVTRELLYTAITRAKHRITVVGEPEAIAEAIRRPVQRDSGLEAQLLAE
jgi:exodeoxyribonuclease V alpha subunit